MISLLLLSLPQAKRTALQTAPAPVPLARRSTFMLDVGQPPEHTKKTALALSFIGLLFAFYTLAGSPPVGTPIGLLPPSVYHHQRTPDVYGLVFQERR